jgi:hypothetical protein
VAPPAIAPSSAPATIDLPRRAGAAGSRVSRASARAELAAAPADDPGTTPMRVFKLGPTPQNVDVYLDGQRQFGYDVDHTTISVPWSGVHVIEFRSSGGCCFVERVEVGPERPLPADAIIARRLKWRPAHLLLTTEPPGTNVHLAIRDPARQTAATTARPGEEVDVPFFPDDDSSKDIEIAVDSGDSFTTERIRVRAGQRLRHVVKTKAGGGNDR